MAEEREDVFQACLDKVLNFLSNGDLVASCNKHKGVP